MGNQHDGFVAGSTRHNGPVRRGSLSRAFFRDNAGHARLFPARSMKHPRRPAHLRRRARSRVGEKLPLSRERRRNSRRPFGYAPYRNNPNYRRHSRFWHGTIGSISRLMKCRARRGAKNSTREKRHETSSGSAWSLRFAALAGWNGRGATVQDGNRQCSQAFGVARRRSRADHGYGPADHAGRGPAVASRRGRRPAAASANGENGPSHTRRSGFTAGRAEPDPRRANGDTEGGRCPAPGSREAGIGPNCTCSVHVSSTEPAGKQSA